MIRGGDFYAIWIEERGLWSTDEQDALRLIDDELDKLITEHKRQDHASDRDDDSIGQRLNHAEDAGLEM